MAFDEFRSNICFHDSGCWNVMAKLIHIIYLMIGPCQRVTSINIIISCDSNTTANYLCHCFVMINAVAFDEFRSNIILCSHDSVCGNVMAKLIHIIYLMICHRIIGG